MYSPFLYSRVKTFVDLYGKGIKNAILGTGLYFPAVTAQSILESGYGDKIPPNSNNFAGIKYNPNLEGVTGYVLGDTLEIVNGKKVKVLGKFSKFKDVESGFKAHIQVLLLDRYKDARLLAKSPEEQIRMIAEAGYTTTPPQTYLNSMKGIIEATRDYSRLGRIR
jgi:flagellum-specific peptidoglycan hydrolase FlgJ